MEEVQEQKKEGQEEVEENESSKEGEEEDDDEEDWEEDQEAREDEDKEEMEKEEKEGHLGHCTCSSTSSPPFCLHFTTIIPVSLLPPFLFDQSGIGLLCTHSNLLLVSVFINQKNFFLLFFSCFFETVDSLSSVLSAIPLRFPAVALS